MLVGKRERRLPGPVRDGGISNFEERIGPETLRICKESREETLRYYIPLFKDEPKATTIYFHSSQDILTLNRGTHLSLIYHLPGFAPETKTQLNLIKRLCFHWWDWLHPEDIPENGIWTNFKVVEELILQDNYIWMPEENRADFIQKRLESCRSKLSDQREKAKRDGEVLQTINYFTALDSIIHK
jgi:hypothetical protein